MSYPRPRYAECPMCGKRSAIHYYHAGYGGFRCCGREHRVLHNSSTNYFAVTAGDLLPTDSRIIIRGDGRAWLCHYYPDGRYPSHYDLRGERPGIPVYIADASCTACGGSGETRVGGFMPCACLKPHTKDSEMTNHPVR